MITHAVFRLEATRICRYEMEESGRRRVVGTSFTYRSSILYVNGTIWFTACPAFFTVREWHKFVRLEIF